MKSRLFALCFSCLPCAAFAAEERFAIVISVDGMRPDAVAQLGEEKLPNLHRLKKEGAYTNNARTDKHYTVTLPNHTGMITSRGVKGENGHNWTGNGKPKIGQFLHRNKKGYLRSMFGVAHDHGLRTGLYASKDKFMLYDLSYNERTGKPDEVGEDNGQDKIDEYLWVDETTDLIKEFVTSMGKQPAHLSFIHLRDPDTKGHAKGWDLTEGSEYFGALMKCDGLIGDILKMIDSDERLRGKTHLVVTADHGGRLKTKTHTDSKSPLNYTIPFFVWGPKVEKAADLYELNSGTRVDPGTVNPEYDAEGLQPVRNADAGNLALRLLGLPAIEGSTVNAKQDLRVSPPVPAAAE